MKNILLFCLFQFIGFYFLGQTTYEFYLDDSIQKYFVASKYGIAYDINTLKDSLPDGLYVFYDVRRKKMKKRNIMIKGEYKNGVKEGRFEKNDFDHYDRKSKKYTISYQHSCNYLNGKKNGVDIEFYLEKGAVYERINSIYSIYNGIDLVTYCEYTNGMKNGLYMNFSGSGHPLQILIFENDKIKTKLLEIQPYTETYP